MNVKQFRDSIYNSLEQGDIDEALAGLVHYLRESDFSKQYNSALLFKSKWETLKREQMNGTISRPEYELAFSKTITGVQALVGEIVANQRGAPIDPPNVSPSSPRSIIWIISALAIFVVVWLFFKVSERNISGSDGKGMEVASDTIIDTAKPTNNANVQNILQPQQFDLPNGSKGAYKALFSTWPTNENEHGTAKPNPNWNAYEIEAFSNTWVGPGKLIMLDNSFTSDFIYDIYFQVLEGTPSLEMTLADDGQNYSTIDLYLNFEDYSFSINEGFTKDNFYKSIAKNFTKEREMIDERIVSKVNLREINKASFVRIGNTVKFYLNNFFLVSFEPSPINFQKISIGAAFKSKIKITNIEVKVSK